MLTFDLFRKPLSAALCLSIGMAAASVTSSCDDDEDVSAPFTDVVDGHDFIDMGLSVRWATANVGADKAEAFGDYFAWGEYVTKDEYSWESYSLGNGDDDLSAYCPSDKRTTLSAADDVASLSWGDSWSTPTSEQWQELIRECTWEWKEMNGVSGYRVTASNGNWLFLPAAGYKEQVAMTKVKGYYGYYWSSSISDDSYGMADCLRFYRQYREPSSFCRVYGMPVRPVCKY